MNAKEKIHKEISVLDGVSFLPHRFGGTEYKIGKREIGHVHGNYLVDIPFTKKIKSELIAEGKAVDHHILAESGWVSIYLEKPSDVENAIELLKKSYMITIEQLKKRQRTLN
jgi:Luciferase